MTVRTAPTEHRSAHADRRIVGAQLRRAGNSPNMAAACADLQAVSAEAAALDHEDAGNPAVAVDLRNHAASLRRVAVMLDGPP